MLYVHCQMVDAAPGEVDPGAFRSAVRSIFEQVARDSERLHGPYRVAIGGLPSRMAVGTKTTATIRVLAESGRRRPECPARASPERGWTASPAASKRTTAAIARVELTAADAGELDPDGAERANRVHPARLLLPGHARRRPQRPASPRAGLAARHRHVAGHRSAK